MFPANNAIFTIRQSGVSTLKMYQMFFRPHFARIFEKEAMPVILDARKSRAEKSHDYRALIVSKSSVLRGLFVSVHMVSINIFPYT